MKTIVIGDIHGLSYWKLIIKQENPDRIIFIGDYFDSFDISGLDQINNFNEIINYKKDNPQVEVIMLIGNHDHHYFPEVGPSGTSGFQRDLYFSISEVINFNREHLQIAYQIDKIIFSHAGISSEWMDKMFDVWEPKTIVEQVNDLFKYKPRKVGFHLEGIDPYGQDTYQSPLWIRPNSLMKANKKTLRKKIIQVVGHTKMAKIDKEGKSDDNRYWFIDVIDTSGEYLVIQDNQIIVNSLKLNL
jgi:predicted MPP superfamily phosphohydrolase